MSDVSLKLAELHEEFVKKKKELAVLRADVAHAGKEKEMAYAELNKLKNQLYPRLGQLKLLRQQRDELAKVVQQFKEERSKRNEEMKRVSLARRESAAKKKNFLQKIGLKIGFKGAAGKTGGVEKVNAQIQFLEKKLETEVMPFEKEKGLNKKIKELKLYLRELQEAGNITAELKEISSQFSEKRKYADESHQNVQKKAQESQEIHRQLVESYDEIKALRKNEAVLQEKCSRLKAGFEEKKKNFEEMQKRVQELAKLFMEQEEKTFHKRLEEKKAEVSEKLKKGKKISMDDILAFQASKE